MNSKITIYSIRTFLVLLILHVVFQVFPFSPLLSALTDVELEKNLPSLFSALILFLSGLFLITIYKQEKTEPRSVWPKYWLILGVIFYQLSLDEWISIHDVLGDGIADAVFQSDGILGSWTIVYMLLLLVFLFGFFNFLKKLPKTTALYFILAGGLYVLGSIGFELVGNAGLIHIPGISKAVAIFLEESLEMAGIILFNAVLLDYLKKQHPSASIQWPRRTLIVVTVLAVIDTIATQIYQLS